MEEMKQLIEDELRLSDKLVYGDLLRFYTPTEDWEPVDPSIYRYGYDEDEDSREFKTPGSNEADQLEQESENTDIIHEPKVDE